MQFIMYHAEEESIILIFIFDSNMIKIDIKFLTRNIKNLLIEKTKEYTFL